MRHPKLLIVSVFMLYSFYSVAQDALPERPSPLAIVRLRYKDAYLKITYSQPHKKNREIFGSLVPYGQVWRLGANEATEITITRDVSVNNQILKAGTYTLLAIPEKDKWTIIINAEPGLWGSYNYNSKLDVMRFEVPVEGTAGTVFEPFTIKADQSNAAVAISMMWDKVKVTVPLKFLN